MTKPNKNADLFEIPLKSSTAWQMMPAIRAASTPTSQVEVYRVKNRNPCGEIFLGVDFSDDYVQAPDEATTSDECGWNDDLYDE